MARALAPLLLLLLTVSTALASERVEEVETPDGVTLRLLRLGDPGGAPVVLAHGFGSNGLSFHVPGRSFARYLGEAGYDVWVLSFRNAGRAPAISGGGDYSFDDLVAWDVPAVVAAVRARTGRAPFWIGHSMGGMCGLAWLQGTERVETWRGPRVRARAELAAERATRLRGLVALGSPSRIAWPRGLRGRWDRNAFARWLGRSPSMNAATRLLRGLPLKRLSDAVSGDPRLERPTRFATRALDRTGALSGILRPGSVDADVLRRGLELAVDDMPAGVSRQFQDGIRRRDLREAHVRDPGRRPYSYADGLTRVRAPVLWVAGRYDRLGNDDVIAADVRRMRTPDKTLLVVEHGHIDMLIGDEAPARVWEPVRAWLDARRSLADTPSGLKEKQMK